MKKAYLLFSIVLFIASRSIDAQYEILHAFNDTAGGQPVGTLTLSGKFFYGMTYSGGKNDSGCIFSMDTNGTGFNDIYDFSGAGNGASPYGGSLKIYGNKLFGMTSKGGANNMGCVFSINTTGTGYMDLLDFNGTNGYHPLGSLTLVGAKMFGMTYAGGANSLGTIFTIDVYGNNYKDLYDFIGGSGGGNPFGDVIIIKDKLFGMSSSGGNGTGNIFSLDSNGTNYTDLFDFNGTNGQNPNNLLTYSHTQFFGMTYSGGINSDGNVFSIDTAGTDFKDMFDFAGGTVPFGSGPNGDVTLSGKILYGMTYSGGANDSGCIFSVDTNGNNYKDLFDFTGLSGNTPFSDLVIIGNTLYGTTEHGGNDNVGVIFKYKDTTTTAGIINLKNQAAIKLYPNPNKGVFTIKWSAVSNQLSTIEIYNMLGEQILVESFHPEQGGNIIDMSSQPSGIYLYKEITENGNLIGEGKLVIQK